MPDPFANSHEFLRRKAEHEAREAERKGVSKETKDRIAAGEKRREALAKPEPRYRPKLPMFSP
jgi:hypothetical protein